MKNEKLTRSIGNIGDDLLEEAASYKAPPASGKNEPEHGDDLLNSYTAVSSLPEIRIAYDPVEASRD